MRMGQGVRTGLGHGGITGVLQTQFSSFLTYETAFVLILAVLENSVLPMGWGSSHATLTVMSEL